MKTRKSMLLLAIIIVAGFTACKKEETVPVVVPVITTTQNLSVNFSTASKFAFFSFKDSTVVANTDSATSKWDFGLRFTTFLVNSNASGPGNAGVILQDGIFSGITSAPTSGYAYDSSSSKLAIKDGSWYNYVPSTRSFAPTAGKVFIFRTADGLHYVKMELLSVDYAPFIGQVPVTLYYKFQYTYQPNGSTNF